MPGSISESYEGPSDVDGQTKLAADRVFEAMNGGGPSMAYPEHGHNWRLAFEADASILARFVRALDAA